MKNIGSITRITFSLTMLCVSAILLATLTGLLPDEREYASNSRAKLCESISSSVSVLVSNHQIREAGNQLELFSEQNDDLVSVALRRPNGESVIEIGPHDTTWDNAFGAESDGCFVVPIKSEELDWGTIQFQFKPLYAGSNRLFSGSLLKLLCLVAVLVALASWWHLRRIIKYLDPSQSVPSRVKEALDSFSEGVVILDTDNRITLVNRGLARHLNKEPDALIGTDFWSLPWKSEDLDPSTIDYTKADLNGVRMQLNDERGKGTAIFSVNASRVIDDNKAYRGLMMAFNDITQLELNRNALLSTLEDLSQSKKEIVDQNKELQFLASRDPLTSCVNRRTFFEKFEELWRSARSQSANLAGVMVDIDFFKSINDTYGHSMGDEVLRETGKLLNSLAREEDIVCRYGGEEFALLVPGLDLDAVQSFAEKIREGMSKLVFPEFTITASLGISDMSYGADDPQQLLDQADKCLYVAKRNGRDQVVRFDAVPVGLEVDESKISRDRPTADAAKEEGTIPYAAVTALLATLSFRDQQTAAHSKRVSNYAAMLAQTLMKPSEVYVIEIAALLHDIGKVGVPDAILLKPAALTEEEWNVMEKHDQFGVEILDQAFRNQTLTDIVRYHHYSFCSADEEQHLSGNDIPIGARILTIVDAFDAMVSDRPYRKGMPIATALEELARCEGSQFDPMLVEQFIKIIGQGGAGNVTDSDQAYKDDVVLSIGEQIESIVTAADKGDSEALVALTGRLRKIAEQNGVDPIVSAATRAINVASEDDQLESLVRESFELLAACQQVRAKPRESYINGSLPGA